MADNETMKSRERQSLTTRQLAESLGVSESSVKRWIDDGTIAAARTAGGHRRIPLADAVRFIRRQRLAVRHPEAMRLATPPLLGAADDEAAHGFHAALLSDDAVRARAIVTGRYVCGADIATIGDRLIRPAFERLGELWRENADGILLEHRAVDTCIRAVADLSDWIAPAQPGAPTAISAAGPDDPYLLPPLLASLTVQEQGSEARNLGPATPLETIGLAVERYRALLCSVCVNTILEKKRHAEWIRLADRLQAAGARFVVGGRCVHSLPTEILNRARVCGSMIELASYAAGVIQGSASGQQSS